MAASTARALARAQQTIKKLRAAQKSAELCSVETYGGDTVAALTVEDLLRREDPSNKPAVFAECRRWRKENWFVGSILSIKADCAGCGQTFAAKNKGEQKRLDAWLKEKTEDGRSTNFMVTARYVRNAIDEALLTQSLVSFWYEGQAPYPLLPEKCKYSDALGREVLHTKFEYTPEQLKAAGFDQAAIRRYSSGWVKLEEARGEFFRVFTLGLAGCGLGEPRMREVFRVCSQNESMEVGESLYAYVFRTVVRTHHLGWEVKSNVNMPQTSAMWDSVRAAAIEKYFKSLQGGIAETTANFDHKISVLWCDPKSYEAKKWATIVERLRWWGGPLAFMLTAPNLNPNFMPLFKAEIKKFRADLVPHLEHVIAEALTPPVELKIHWTDECFADMRLLWDMVKTLVQQGPASLTTGLRVAGLNPVEEAERKISEADDPAMEKKSLPLHVPNGLGGGDNGGKGGRTAGVRDGGGQGAGAKTKAK